MAFAEKLILVTLGDFLHCSSSHPGLAQEHEPGDRRWLGPGPIRPQPETVEAGSIPAVSHLGSLGCETEL